MQDTSYEDISTWRLKYGQLVVYSEGDGGFMANGALEQPWRVWRVKKFSLWKAEDFDEQWQRVYEICEVDANNEDSVEPPFIGWKGTFYMTAGGGPICGYFEDHFYHVFYIKKAGVFSVWELVNTYKDEERLELKQVPTDTHPNYCRVFTPKPKKQEEEEESEEEESEEEEEEEEEGACVRWCDTGTDRQTDIVV